MEDSHADAYFESGQTIRLEASASVPEATVLGIFEEEGELLYRRSRRLPQSGLKPTAPNLYYD
jgi:hypothetical protein